MSFPTQPPIDPKQLAQEHAKDEHFKMLMREASAIKGVSLWKDARRRLKQNKVAVLSLYFLILLTLLAFLTPFIPFQSPRIQDPQYRKFVAPTLASVSLADPESSLNFKNNSFVAELAQFDTDVREKKNRLEGLTGKELKEGQNELSDYVAAKNPLNKIWIEPGFVSRVLIRCRVAIFGDWCIPSICGTDMLGRDLLSRIFWGARISLAVGVMATLVSLLIGVSYGAISGYFGGWIDAIMMRIVDVLYSVPFIFVVIFIITFIRDETVKAQLKTYGINEITVFFILIGAIYWLTMARVIRGQVLSLKNDQFVEAARAIGASKFRIVFLHLIPNVFGIVIVYLTLTIPAVMLFESFLSFLGLGVEPPDVSWGVLVQEGIKVITPLRTYWWLIVFPGIIFAATLFSLNFLGDGLRDALDPRMKNR